VKDKKGFSLFGGNKKEAPPKKEKGS
jgi:hypothetical protein